MKRKQCLILAVPLLLSLVTTGCNSTNCEIKYANSQIGVVLGKKNKVNEATINNKLITPYDTYSKNITLKYETYHIDERYDNRIIINDSCDLSLETSSKSADTFYAVEKELLGLNIVNGQMKVKFKAGKDETKIGLDTFYVRNVVLVIDGVEIWSNEYTKANYINEKIGIGEVDINSDVRFGMVPERTFTFNVNEEMLDAEGYILDESLLKEENINVTVKNKEYQFANLRASYNINLNKNEVIDSDKTIEITTKNVKASKYYLDGVEVNLPLKLTASCWSKGKHTLTVLLLDETGKEFSETYEFELKDNGEPISSTTHTAYLNGVASSLPTQIKDLGKQVNDDNDIVTPFSETPYINFEITNNPTGNVVWKGKVNKNRVAFMQMYNYVSAKFETVSTSKVNSSEEEVILAYNYSNQNDYIKDGKSIVRVSSRLVQEDYTNPDALFHHLSDVQYIVQKSAVQGDSVLGREAKAALTSMSDYVVEKQPNYSWISGDLTQKTVEEQEWIDVLDMLVDPILEGNVPLGVSSGNHDVGGLNAQNPNGSNGLDDVLKYGYFNKYVGESKFSEYDYYKGSFENNRSHYDVINVLDNEFLFLHLGWGSSIYGVHVSSKDINWAKQVLQANTDKTVVISTHEYLNGKGALTATGIYVYEQLVKPYKNVKFVFSGHCNGSSKVVTNIDDNNDGVDDRVVLQLLTDYQEEEDLYGATFIREMSLYKEYNNILFDIYSPFFVDNDIYVFENCDIVKSTARFNYAFDLSNDGFGLITKEFK